MEESSEDERSDYEKCRYIKTSDKRTGAKYPVCQKISDNLEHQAGE